MTKSIETTAAQFRFNTTEHGLVRINWRFKDGKYQTVHLITADEEIGVNNFQGRWKPCVTHAKKLMQLHLKKRKLKTVRSG